MYARYQLSKRIFIESEGISVQIHLYLTRGAGVTA